MAELTHQAKAIAHQAAAKAELEAAMATKPENRAAYSRWIQAHEHMLAAAKLLNFDSAEQITLRDWAFKEISFGCSEHDSFICTLLVNKLDGRQLHIPASHVKVEPHG